MGDFELKGSINLGELATREKWLHPLSIIGEDKQYKKLPTGRVYVGGSKYIGHILLGTQNHITVYTTDSEKLNVITLSLGTGLEIAWDV